MRAKLIGVDPNIVINIPSILLLIRKYRYYSSNKDKSSEYSFLRRLKLLNTPIFHRKT